MHEVEGILEIQSSFMMKLAEQENRVKGHSPYSGTNTEVDPTVANTNLEKSRVDTSQAIQETWTKWSRKKQNVGKLSSN